MLILGVETSCDETSAAVVEDGRRALSNIVSSQTDHAEFGGVVPEVASRRHVELILPTIELALRKASVLLEQIDALGVINRPGLIGALIVGVAAAKTIAWARSLPLVSVHHLEAHIYANWLLGKEIDLPAICLVVSGGHSDIVLMRAHGDYTLLARTRDDAAGECFDKCARAMGLGYPGGPVIDRLAREGNPNAVEFPRAKVGDTLDFSFSGLKTAVVRFYQKHGSDHELADIAASFQQAVVDVLVDHTMRAAREQEVPRVLMAGGVAANSALGSSMRSACEARGFEFSCPPPILCTDNAAMAASAAFYSHQRGLAAGADLDCFASEPLGNR